MLFNSIQFLIFFPIVVLLYFLVPDSLKNVWLLISSYYFYMCWNAKYALLILFSTLITYFGALVLEKIKSSSDNVFQKKLVLTLCIIINLGILFFYKYFNFTSNIVTFFLNKLHIQVNIPVFDVILPVGISFYTFQALGYIIDVYRDEIFAEKNFLKYALFVSFFPQLVAGPIERSKNLIKQLSCPSKFSFKNLQEGFSLMLWGFFMKLVLADRIAIYVDKVYEDYQSYPGYYLIVATILFSFQIYCDFSGYSTIAMGAAKILGIQLMDNFNAPYIQTTVANFWRNWHISLTSWFKDYLYIPLGGSRKGKIRKYINKFIVFSVSGLWHGASTSYIIWGALNGLYQIIGEELLPVRKKINKILALKPDSFSHKLAAIIVTYVLVDFSWIFFRASSTGAALSIISSMVHAENPWIIFDQSLFKAGLNWQNWIVLIIGLLVLLIADLLKQNGVIIRNKISEQELWFRYFVYISGIMVILIFGVWGPVYDASSFIYFQF